ncbi:hypothetical protein BOW53_14420 [Solemya pervernicosa gill symbiont]|uniref:23S rRNA (Adenine(2030)-N(6))-methyltransferase RlmJ n=1 Tax=Solemya pervernicosa gill symbiont TaxID=642797 RepID=A0A1T2L0T2_9GAMM|nr:23S rRNA (adenine(2030)-N(6))-methyltransferase RlmJ [Solemya pervernicosa gill symbiont]OOZ38715.1 hypothetical protein BOW53_14420 [Solemya pervernicosa gill symbiont]
MNYQHAKHAGNYGDLLKHSVLCQVLQSLTQQDKPLFYSETHAGAGGYRLDQRGVDPFGIERLWGVSNAPQALADYLTMVAAFNRSEILQNYPGSPWFAQQLLRGEDRMRLFELSPEPYQQLVKSFSHDVRIELFAGDGYSGVVEPIPGMRCRQVVLIDPPYESVSDYSDAVDTLLEIYRREPPLTAMESEVRAVSPR